MRSIFFFPITLIAVILIISCAGLNSQIELERSGIQYYKPQTSTQLIKGEKVEYELWFNKNKWKFLDHENHTYKMIEEQMKKKNEHLIQILNHISNEALAVITDTPVPITLEYLYTYNSKLIRNGGGHIIGAGERMVNGNDVLYIKYSRKSGWINWIYLIYYLSNKTGCTKVCVAAKEYLFEKHESDMIDLLNGFVDPYSEIQPTKSDDDIESKLLKLKSLRDKGLITQEDYDKKKDKLLNSY